MKRTNLWLNDDEVKEAQKILRAKELTLSAWVRLQIRKLIAQSRLKK